MTGSRKDEFFIWVAQDQWNLKREMIDSGKTPSDETSLVKRTGSETATMKPQRVEDQPAGAIGTLPLSRKNLLLAVFTHNRGVDLERCLASMQRFCPGFQTIVVDDNSTNPDTKAVIEGHRHMFREVFYRNPATRHKRTGGLHQNIAFAFEYAAADGFDYLFMIQDDMQFLRALDEGILDEYSRLFGTYDNIIEVDPRFLRRGSKVVVDRKLGGYTYMPDDDRRGYAAVGILHIPRLKSIDWSFEISERANKEKAMRLGLLRVFPFRPIMMHAPYPTIFRKGKRFSKQPFWLVRPGSCFYAPFTDSEIARMDSRDLSVVPYAYDFLRPQGLGLAWPHYWIRQGTVY